MEIIIISNWTYCSDDSGHLTDWDLFPQVWQKKDVFSCGWKEVRRWDALFVRWRRIKEEWFSLSEYFPYGRIIYGFDDNIPRLIAKLSSPTSNEKKKWPDFSVLLQSRMLSSRWIFIFRSFFHCQHDKLNFIWGKRYRGGLASDHVTLSSLERFSFSFHSSFLRFSVRFHLVLLVGEILVIFHMNGDLITRWLFDY